MRYAILYVLLTMSLSLPAADADRYCGYDHYRFDPNDFAADWVDYVPNGTGYDWLSGEPFNHPTTVLGRPAIDTTGDDWYIPEDQPVPVNPVYPAFRSHELLYLGEGGYVTVQFSHPVRDDQNNPYGIDFIVFGNAFQVIGGNQSWINGDPAAMTVVSPGQGFYEPGIVSVSQDGVTWYSFTNDPGFMASNPDFIRRPLDAEEGPFCDAFAPTLGRVYVTEPNLADPNVGAWNRWWGEPTNPTFPVDPNLGFESFGGFTVAEICQIYGHSAGGTGYDISRLDLPVDPLTGKKWFQYVRVDDKSGGGSAEIDAFADVSACGDWKHPFPPGDMTQDCIVNLEDFAVLAGFWAVEITDPGDPAHIADLRPDDSVNIGDLMVMTDQWLQCTWDCE